MLLNITEYPYDLMTMYGTMQLNDLGNYQACRALPNAAYAIVSMNISHTPLALFLGACLPNQCIQDDYWRVTDAVSSALTRLYREIGFGNSTEDHEGLFHYWTNITIMVRKTDEMLQDARDDTRSGLIAYVAIVGILLLLVSVTPSLWHMMLKCKEHAKSGDSSTPVMDANLDTSMQNPLLNNSNMAAGQQILNINQT